MHNNTKLNLLFFCTVDAPHSVCTEITLPLLSLYFYSQPPGYISGVAISLVFFCSSYCAICGRIHISSVGNADVCKKN